MTNRTVISVSLTVLTSASILLNARADITTGLVGCWNLSEGPGSSTVADSSGNGNTGTLTNYADLTFNNMWTTASDPSNGGPYALDFTNSGVGFGTNTYVLIPDSPSLNLPTTNKTWTLSAWVNCGVAGASEPANAGIISKGVSGAEAYALYMSGGKFAGVFHNVSLGSAETATSTTIPAANTWYHVAVTVSVPLAGATAEAILYVNGVRQSGANNNTYTTVYGTNLPVTIGCRAAANGSISLPFEGIIDEVRIYDRALSAADVMQLYTNAPSNSGIGYWNGHAGSGGNATLDNTSLNFSTNLWTLPVGTADTLSDLLNVEFNSTPSLPNSCYFADSYYSGKSQIAVQNTNLTIAAGGVSLGTVNAPGTIYFQNGLVTYILNSSDNIGIEDASTGNKTYLVQSGAGTVILTGINTFSGGTTINAGTVQVGNGAATGSPLGSGNVLDNSTLVFYGNDSPTFSRVISGTGSVTQKGSGTLTLNAVNTYTGNTVLTSGTLNANAISDGGVSAIGYGNVILSGGTLAYTGSGDNTARTFSGTAGTTSTIDVPNGVTLTLAGLVSGSAAWTVNKIDGGTLVVGGTGAQNNAFFGMNINGGTVILNKTGTSGNALGGATTVGAGGTLQLSGGGYGAEIYSGNTTPLTVSSGGVFDLNGQNNTIYSLSLSGAGISASGALINTASSTTSTLTGPIALAAAATIGGSTSLGNITLPGAIVGAGSLTYAGTGTLTLAGSNAYSGGTMINSGILDASVADSLPGTVTVNAGGNLELDSPYAMSPVGALNLAGSLPAGAVNLNFLGTQAVGVLIVGSTTMPAGTYGASAINPNGVFSGSGLLLVVESYWDANGTDAGSASSANGGGTGNWNNSALNWWVSGSSDTTWTANTVPFFAGTAGTVTVADNVAALGLIFTTAGYTMTNSDGTSVLTLGGNNPIITIPAGNTSIGCDIAGGGSGIGLTVSGAGTLTLNGTNTYGGNTLITNGATLSVNTIADGGTSAISAGALTMGGGTLSYTGSSAASTLRAVTETGPALQDIDVPAGTLTLNGQVGGTNFSKTGAGTLILGGAGDNPSLDMAINAGTVIITKISATNAHGLGGGLSTVASGAGVQLNGTGVYQLFNTCALTINNGGFLDLNSQSDSMSTLTLSGAGPSGGGALISSTTTATSFLTNGGSGVVLAANATVGGSGSIWLASKITGASALTYAGTGVLTLAGAGTYSGGTTINSGATVLLTNSASGAGTGTITDNGTLGVGISNLTLTVPISGPGIVNIYESPSANLSLGGSMSGFTGTLNCPASPGGTAKVEILTTAVGLSSAATVNLAAGGTFYVANAGVTIPCLLNIYGGGNSEPYGALRIENGATISGPVILYGNTTMGNGSSGASKLATISGPISQTNGTFGVTFTAEPGTIVLSGTNTYTGPTTISGGVLDIGGAGNLGGGNYAGLITNNATLFYASSAPQTLSGVVSGTGALDQSGFGPLTLTGVNTFTGPISNATSLTIGGAGDLGNGAYAGAMTNNGTFTYNSSAAQTLSGTISGTGTLTQSASGTLTLSGINSYTGGTVITNGSTLALTSVGSINASSSISIAAGATFDVSAFALSYVLSGSTTLNASGAGTSVGATAAAIKGGASGSVSLGSVALTFTPTAFSGDSNHPALYISQGALSLTGSALTVNNAAATPLGAGTYSLIQVAGGSITAASTNVTVTGAGLTAGATASLAVSGGSLNLVVTGSTVVPVPAINNFTFSGASLIFSGTNGPNSGTYYVLTSTNLTTPLSQWANIATNTFSPTGTFSVTNTVSASPSFFVIEIAH